MEILTHPSSRDNKAEAHAHAPQLAAIDLGTNCCRLLIAVPKHGKLHIIDSFSRIVRLGEDLTRTGKLSQAAMDRTVSALKICADKISAKHVRFIRAVATEACRRASNAGDLVRRVERETGIHLDIVSAREEARLAAKGCGPLVQRSASGALVFDIGGGSTEVIWLRRRSDGRLEMVHFASVPAGVMTLFDPEDPDSFDHIRETMIARFREIRAEMDQFGRFDPEGYHLLGTSGTVTTLAGIALGLTRYVRSRVDGSWHDCTRIAGIVDHLVHISRAERIKIGCVGEERTDLVIPGCAIYAAIQHVWPCDRLRVADRGLREGILRELLKESQK